MQERSESLEFLHKQLYENKKELSVATSQLNRNLSKLEYAEAAALLACSHNAVWKMAHDHQLQAGQVLLTYNLELEKLQRSLFELQKNAQEQLSSFQHFIRVSQRCLMPQLRDTLSNKCWQSMLTKLADELGMVVLHHTKIKSQMQKALTDLVSGRQKRTYKIKQFQETTQQCFAELNRITNVELQNPNHELLQIQIRKLIEKRMLSIREIQRYQQVLDNILGLEQQHTVKPTRLLCDLVQEYVHRVQQQQITLLAKIRILNNPEKAANDVLIDIDENDKRQPKR